MRVEHTVPTPGQIQWSLWELRHLRLNVARQLGVKPEQVRITVEVDGVEKGSPLDEALKAGGLKTWDEERMADDAGEVIYAVGLQSDDEGWTDETLVVFYREEP